MNAKMMMAGTALTLGTMFTGAALAEETIKPNTETCIVRNGQMYEWRTNVDKDVTFYDEQVIEKEVVKGPVVADRNLNITTYKDTIGIYFKNPSCKQKLQ